MVFTHMVQRRAALVCPGLLGGYLGSVRTISSTECIASGQRFPGGTNPWGITLHGTTGAAWTLLAMSAPGSDQATNNAPYANGHYVTLNQENTGFFDIYDISSGSLVSVLHPPAGAVSKLAMRSNTDIGFTISPNSGSTAYLYDSLGSSFTWTPAGFSVADLSMAATDGNAGSRWTCGWVRITADAPRTRGYAALVQSGGPSHELFDLPSDPHTFNTILSTAFVVTNSDVWVGGNTDSGQIYVPMRLWHWDGMTWTNFTLPTPAGTIYCVLNALHGSATNDIWAVGDAILPGGFATAYIAHWDGITWTLVPTPTWTYAGLADVHAASTTNAWAVGLGCPDNSLLAYHWDGSVWTNIPVTY